MAGPQEVSRKKGSIEGISAKHNYGGAGEMIQWFRGPAGLPEISCV